MPSIHKSMFVSIILAGLIFRPSWLADRGEELMELGGVQGGLVIVLNDEPLTSEFRLTAETDRSNELRVLRANVRTMKTKHQESHRCNL